MMGQTIYWEWSSRLSSWRDRRRGCSGAKSAYLSTLHLCNKNDKSDVLDLCWLVACLRGAGRKNNWKRYPVTMWHELFWHRLAHICNCLHLALDLKMLEVTWHPSRGLIHGSLAMLHQDRGCQLQRARTALRDEGGKRVISGFLSYLRQFSQEPQEGILNHQVNIWCRLNLMSKSAIKAKLFAWNSHEQFFFNLETPRAICKSIVFNGY